MNTPGKLHAPRADALEDYWLATSRVSVSAHHVMATADQNHRTNIPVVAFSDEPHFFEPSDAELRARVEGLLAT